jgi:hypothetical protein
MKLLRVELWSNHPYAGGVVEYRFPSLISASSIDDVNGDSDWVVTVPLPDIDDEVEIRNRKILRIVFDNEGIITWVDRRITRYRKVLDEEGRRIVVMTARSLLSDLAMPNLISLIDGSGRISYYIETSGMLTSEHLSEFIIRAANEGGYTHWAPGNLDADPIVSVTYDADTPLGGLRKVLDINNMEPVVRDNGVDKLFLDLVQQLGSDLEPMQALVGKNVQSAGVEFDAENQANRIIPLGAPLTNELARTTMQEARWAVRFPVTEGSNWRIFLSDLGALGFGPVSYDGALDGLSVQFISRYATTVISSRASDQSIVVAKSVDPLKAPRSDDFVYFYSPVGERITYVDDPASIAQDGVLIAELDLPDIVGVTNVLKNPAFRLWQQGLPAGWTVYAANSNKAGLSVTKETDSRFWQTAGSSAKVVTDLEWQGMYTQVVPLSQARERDNFLSYFITVYVDPATQARYILWIGLHSSQDSALHAYFGIPVTDPAQEQYVRITDATGKWTTIGVEGINLAEIVRVNPSLASFDRVQLLFTQFGDVGGTVYVDHVQVTQTLYHQKFVDGSGGAFLYREALEKLERYSGPSESHSLTMADLFRADGSQFSEEEFALGRRVETIIESLGIETTLRIMNVQREYSADGSSLMSDIGLSEYSDAITSRLAR